MLAVRDGEHGFDGEIRFSDEWLRETLKFAVDAWVK
jgi:hypothetical protein